MRFIVASALLSTVVPFGAVQATLPAPLARLLEKPVVQEHLASLNPGGRPGCFDFVIDFKTDFTLEGKYLLNGDGTY